MIDADVVEDPLESTGGVATHHRHDPDEFETRLHREGRPVHEPGLHLAPALVVLVALIGVERPQLVALPPLGPLRQPLLGASTRARCIDRAAVLGPEASVEVGSAGAAPKLVDEPARGKAMEKILRS